jgi:hypothetical protein
MDISYENSSYLAGYYWKHRSHSIAQHSTVQTNVHLVLNESAELFKAAVFQRPTLYKKEQISL